MIHHQHLHGEEERAQDGPELSPSDRHPLVRHADEIRAGDSSRHPHPDMPSRQLAVKHQAQHRDDEHVVRREETGNPWGGVGDSYLLCGHCGEERDTAEETGEKRAGSAEPGTRRGAAITAREIAEEDAEKEEESTENIAEAGDCERTQSLSSDLLGEKSRSPDESGQQ